MRTHLRRAALGTTLTCLLAIPALTGCGASQDGPGADQQGSPSASTSPGQAPAEAVAAADWLGRQTRHGVVTTSYENPPGSGKWTTTPDYGLTLDVFFALDAVDRDPGTRAAILDTLERRAGAYVGTGADAYAGATGKLLTAAETAGRDPASYAGSDQVARLESLVHTRKDSELGRAKDTWDPGNTWGGDYSNTIGQSWVVRALAGAGSPLTGPTVRFLLEQQCHDGYFRLGMESADHTCDTGTAKESAPSVDATGFAVQALEAVRDDPSLQRLHDEVGAAVDDASRWLTSAQAGDGSFVDADSGTPNANSTGVAAQTLLVLGDTDAAGRAASWLAAHQVGGGRAGVTGAVAFDDQALAQGRSHGIRRPVRAQWLRATAQAAPGLMALDAGQGGTGSTG